MLAFERGYIARFPKMEQKRAMTDSKQADSSIANSHQLTSSQLHEIFNTYFLGQKPTFERGYIAEFSISSKSVPLPKSSKRDLEIQIGNT